MSEAVAHLPAKPAAKPATYNGDAKAGCLIAVISLALFLTGVTNGGAENPLTWYAVGWFFQALIFAAICKPLAMA